MKLETLQPILSRQAIFRDLDPDYLNTIVGCAANVRFKAGTFIFREGEPADHFFLIRAGKVALQIHHPERGPLTIETLGEGDILGWSWLFPPTPTLPASPTASNITTRSGNTSVSLKISCL